MKTHGAELQTLSLKPAAKAAQTKIGLEDFTHDTTSSLCGLVIERGVFVVFRISIRGLALGGDATLVE